MDVRNGTVPLRTYMLWQWAGKCAWLAPRRNPGRGYSAARMSSTRERASPKSIWVLSLKNSGFWTPA